MCQPCPPSIPPSLRPVQYSAAHGLMWQVDFSALPPQAMPARLPLPQYSAAHGLEWWQVDFSYYVIRAMELTGLAWEVKRPGEAQKAKLRLKA